MITSTIENVIERVKGFRLRPTATTAVAGSLLVGACTTDPITVPVAPLEATERREVVFCFEDYPNCTPEDVPQGRALGLLGTGNSVELNEIPELCNPEDTNNVEQSLEKEIAPWVLEALIAVEDERFCYHDGVDGEGLFGAAVDTLRGNPRGGSTIAMQYARIENPAIMQLSTKDRKLYEITRAKELIAEYGHTGVAKLYLNNYYFGGGAYGIEAAAQINFGVSAKDLSIDQGAALIAMLQNPGKYVGSSTDVTANAQADERLRIERNEVLDTLWASGFYDPTRKGLEYYQQLDIGRIPPQKFNASLNLAPAEAIEADFALQQIINDINSQIEKGIEEGKLPDTYSIYNFSAVNTNINSTEQTALAGAWEKNMGLLRPDQGQLGAVLLDETGGITAYIPGVYSEDGPNIDLLRALMNGGSSDKGYFAASLLLIDGYSPDTILGDPEFFEWLNYDGNGSNYQPKELEDGARCPTDDQCTLLEVIKYSAQWGLLEHLKQREAEGIPALQNGIEIMKAFGLVALQTPGPAAVVGGSEVSFNHRALGAMELMGLSGMAIPKQNALRLWNSVVTKGGVVIPRYNPELPLQRILPEEVARQVTDMERASVFGGTSKRLQPIAEKTDIATKSATLMDNVAAATTGVFCYEEENRAYAVLQRDPNTLTRSLGGDSDGGNVPTQLVYDVIDDLTEETEYCKID